MAEVLEATGINENLLIGGSYFGNFTYLDFINLVEGFGFIQARTRGSHHIYKHPEIIELVNIQNVDGQVKPNQIKQFIELIEKYNLKLENKK